MFRHAMVHPGCQNQCLSNAIGGPNSCLQTPASLRLKSKMELPKTGVFPTFPAESGAYPSFYQENEKSNPGVDGFVFKWVWCCKFMGWNGAPSSMVTSATVRSHNGHLGLQSAIFTLTSKLSLVIYIQTYDIYINKCIYIYMCLCFPRFLHEISSSSWLNPPCRKPVGGLTLPRTRKV